MAELLRTTSPQAAYGAGFDPDGCGCDSSTEDRKKNPGTKSEGETIPPQTPSPQPSQQPIEVPGTPGHTETKPPVM